MGRDDLDFLSFGERDFISYATIEEALGLDEAGLDKYLRDRKPPVDPEVFYGVKHIRRELYAEIEAEWLKHRHKRATYRQAIGLIGRWDCKYGEGFMDESDHAIAVEWSKLLNMRLTPADVAEMVYIFVTTREEKETQYRRPTDVDFIHIAYRWSLHSRTKINGDDAERLLSIFVEKKDFFEPLPMPAAKVQNNNPMQRSMRDEPHSY